jgi:hypothetical protein
MTDCHQKGGSSLYELRDFLLLCAANHIEELSIDEVERKLLTLRISLISDLTTP